MMRSVLLWASENRVLADRLPRYGFVKRAVRRFMPGEEMVDALTEAERLGDLRLKTILTLLGEKVSQPGEAALVVSHYQELLEEIVERGLDTEISVKLTQLGLDLDKDMCRTNLEAIVAAGRVAGRTVWVDIESSPYVDVTLELYRHALSLHSDVGLCLQAYLFRTAADLADLLPLNPSIRLVKGAYAEPPGIAFPKKKDVDENYFQLSTVLLDAVRRGGTRAVFATHDDRLVRRIKLAAADRELARGDIEFHMLYGINSGVQESLAAEGHTVGALISYGSAWFPWYMRRLAERPANLWFVLRKAVSR